MKIKNPLWMGVALLALAGCGGGGGDSSPPPPQAMPSGQLDTTFGTNGRVADAGSLVLGLNDQPYVAMPTGIARLGENGQQVGVFGQGSYGHLIVDGQGNVYAFATLPSPGISKFHPDGRPFTEFGVNGHAALGSRTDSIFAFGDLVRGPDGSLYLVATRSFFSSSARYGAIAKFDSTGRPVTSFGNDGGILDFDMPGGRLSMASVARVDGQGNLYVSGWAVHGDAQDFTIYAAKVDRDGAFVREFGSDGVWFSPRCFPGVGGNAPGFDLGNNVSATTIALDAGGDVLVGGRCQPAGSPSRPMLARLDSRGDLVASFRDGGLQPGLFGPDSGDSLSNVTGLLVAPGSAIYATGSKGDSSVPCGDFAIAKLTAAGEAITGFGSSGVVTLDVAGDRFSEPALDSRGRVYLSGGSFVPCPTGRIPGYVGSLYRMSG